DYKTLELRYFRNSDKTRYLYLRVDNELHSGRKIDDNLCYLPANKWDIAIAKNSSLWRVNLKQYELKENEKLIVVLSFAKSASTAVAKSVLGQKNASGSEIPVYHIHSLVHPQIPEGCNDITQISSLALRDAFLKYHSCLNWKFMTGIREPVGSMLSAYYHRFFESKGHPSKDELVTFLDFRLKAYQGFLDSAFKAQVNLDPYQTKFDKTAGFGVLVNRNLELLMYRVESLNDSFGSIFDDYLGVQNINLKRDNVANYRNIQSRGMMIDESYYLSKKDFKLPCKRLKEIYSHKSVTHFYTEQEIAQYIDHWSE
ncbi:MAG: hypothetical protein MI748_04185, partial [Opitutales bacterium]|nr:hypothetical protein [Opitutales bacterium]